jgi:hypothetical protein
MSKFPINEAIFGKACADWLESLPDGVDEDRVHGLLLEQRPDDLKQAGEFAFYFPRCLCDECVSVRQRYGVDPPPTTPIHYWP